MNPDRDYYKAALGGLVGVVSRPCPFRFYYHEDDMQNNWYATKSALRIYGFAYRFGKFIPEPV